MLWSFVHKECSLMFFSHECDELSVVVVDCLMYETGLRRPANYMHTKQCIAYFLVAIACLHVVLYKE